MRQKDKMQKSKKIAAKIPSLLDVSASYYRGKLSMRAVGMEKHASAEALLKCGADPNIISDGNELSLIKMKIVEALASQSVNYWATEVPIDQLEQLRKLYLDTREKYLNEILKIRLPN